VFDTQAALCAVLVAATTPLLFRMPTTYYPEVMEIAFAGGATALTLLGLRQSTRGHAASLLAAGVVDGGGILVRRTALSVPLALSVLVVLSERARPRQAIVGILLLGAGFAIPVALETLFYLVMTGDPLGRLRIDNRHVLIPSVHLRGSTFTGGSPLFNWKLASEWEVPSAIRVHWTINPVLRVLTSPGLLLAPWLCLAGGVAASRRGGIARRYAIFAGVGFLGQYILNTFVLVIAPDTRYFSVSVALALPLAGFWLRHLPRVLQGLVAGLLLVTPCLLIMWFAPAPAHLMPALEQYMAREQPIYVSQDLAAAAAILLAHSGRAAQVRPLQDQDRVPVGGLAVLDPYGWSAGAAHRCVDGQVEWQPIGAMRPFEASPGPCSTRSGCSATCLRASRATSMATRIACPWSGAPADRKALPPE